MKYKWNYKYAQSTQPLFGENPSLICQEYKNLPAIELSPSLFIGDGEGRNSRFIAKSNIDVTAIDFSEVATKKALDEDKKLGIQVNRYIADAKYWNDKNKKFQSCFMIFLHVPEKERQAIFSNIKKNLHMGGSLFIEGFSVQQMLYHSGGPRDPNLLYDTQLIIKELSSFTLIKSIITEEFLNDAPGHVGLASINRLHFTKTIP